MTLVTNAINPNIEKQAIKASTIVAHISLMFEANKEVVIKGNMINIKLGMPKNSSKNEVIDSATKKLTSNNK